MTEDEKLAAALMKVASGIERLNRDVSKVEGLIRFAGPDKARWFFEETAGRVAGKNRGSSNPIDMIEDMRDAIRGTEYHVGAIRALLNEISGDAAAREAIKPYLKKVTSHAPCQPTPPARKSPSPKCVPLACAASWCTAQTSAAATRSRSARIAAPMISGCRTSRIASPAPPAGPSGRDHAARAKNRKPATASLSGDTQTGSLTVPQLTSRSTDAAAPPVSQVVQPGLRRHCQVQTAED